MREREREKAGQGVGVPRVAREESRGVGRFPSRNQSSPGLRSRRVFSLQASAVPCGCLACCSGLYIPTVVVGTGQNFPIFTLIH